MEHFLFAENCKFEPIKTKKTEPNKPKLPKGFVVDPKLTGKYDDQPLFKDKVDKANHILKTIGLPKFEQPVKTSTTHNIIICIAGRYVKIIGFCSLFYSIFGQQVIYFAVHYIFYIGFLIGIYYGCRYSKAPTIANT